MIDPKDYFERGLALHGHRCPAMPLGLRAGAAAMNALGVERAKDGQLLAIVELGENHCATCFADGVQAITGCTFGKGTIRKLNWGKWGLTLIDKKTQRAVRVAATGESMMISKRSDFIVKYRQQGVPASQVPDEVSRPAIERVMGAPDEQLFKIGQVVDYQYQEPPHSFNAFICDSCGEMTVEEYGRSVNGQHLCIPCASGQPVSDPGWVDPLQ